MNFSQTHGPKWPRFGLLVLLTALGTGAACEDPSPKFTFDAAPADAGRDGAAELSDGKPSVSDTAGDAAKPDAPKTTIDAPVTAEVPPPDSPAPSVDASVPTDTSDALD